MSFYHVYNFNYYHPMCYTIVLAPEEVRVSDEILGNKVKT